MPKYHVELSDGRKFEVDADGPPTEADLADYINPPTKGAAASAPAGGSSLLSGAADVAKGFAKGAATELTGPADTLGRIIDRMRQASFGGKPTDTRATDAFNTQFEATNKAQSAGKGLEFATSLALPGVGKGLKAASVAKDAEAAGMAAAKAGLKPTATAATSIAGKTPLLEDLAARAGAKQSVQSIPSKLPKGITIASGTGTGTAASGPTLEELAARAGANQTATVAAKKAATTVTTGTGSKTLPLTNIEDLAAQVGPKQAIEAPASKVAKGTSLATGTGTSFMPAPLPTPKAAATAVAKEVESVAAKVPAATALAPEAVPATFYKVAGNVDNLVAKHLDAGDVESAASVIEKELGRFFGGSKGAKVSKLDPGFISSGLLLKATGGAVAGGVAGSQVGDTPEDRVQNTAIGAGLGAVAVPLIVHAMSQGAPKTIQNLMYTSMLSSPASVEKAYLGGVGGAISDAVEKIGSGNVSGGAAILKRLFSPSHVADIAKGLKNPSSAATGALGLSGTETLVGRVYNAVNAPAIKAMAAGGTSETEAWQKTLSGPPTTELGKKILTLWNQYFTLRLATTMFPRVGIQIAERGLERTPLGLIPKLGLQTGTRGEGVAKAVLGPLAGAAAYAGGDSIPDWAKPYVTAASGPYQLLTAGGFAARAKRGKGAPAQASAALGELAKATPFPQFGPQETLMQVATGAQLVPNALADVARARDPYDREVSTKGGGFFARTKAKVPGLRETLPVRGAKTNVLGEPNEDRSSAAVRFFSRPPSEATPFKGVPEGVATELQRLDVNIDPPSFKASSTLKQGKRSIDVPPDLAERDRLLRRQFVVPRVEHVMQTNAYQSADDAGKRRILQRTVSNAETAGKNKARVELLKSLRSKGTTP